MAKNLFPELEFTRENILVWAKEQVALEPFLGVAAGDLASTEETQIPNSTVHVLRDVLGEHYLRNFLQYDKNDLLHEIMTYVCDGVGSPLNAMGESELLDEIMQLCSPSEDGGNAFEFETMDEFVCEFVKGEW